MTKTPSKDIGASVRARLLDLARKRGEDFQLVLTRYANERLLFRLASSRHAQRFVLQLDLGGNLLQCQAWLPQEQLEQVQTARRSQNREKHRPANNRQVGPFDDLAQNCSPPSSDPVSLADVLTQRLP